MPSAKALVAALEDSIGQSMPSIVGVEPEQAADLRIAGRDLRQRVPIQLAFEPPYSVEPISPINSGLEGASVPAIRW